MNKLVKKITAGIVSASIAASCMLSVSGGMFKTSAADTNNDDWLHAEGSRLYDENGNEVWLTGANWFGLNCTENSLHYLWSADIDDVLQSIADHGINVLRFPISTELLVTWMEGKPDPTSSLSANNDPYYKLNADFCNSDGTLKNSMEIFDITIQKLKKYGLKCFIDVHSPSEHNSGHNYNLWYYDSNNSAASSMATGNGALLKGKEITEDMWMDSLTWLAKKYSNDDTILGYDLKNEPHGKGQEGATAAKWDGSTDKNNWAYAATKMANSILNVNPNALIFIEGVEQSVKDENKYTWGQPDSKTDPPYIPAWWGGNLRGVKKYPVKPDSGTSQIVYSPHDYGPAVYDQTWFRGSSGYDFTEKTLLDDYWYDTWAYINDQDIAPLLIGEWGGYMDGAENQKWMETIRDYMIKKHINHTFWCLNTNSGDTGGLWTGLQFSQGSGTTVEWDTDKYNLLEPALWQTAKSGKYISLDHTTALGANGISLSDYYNTYKSSEGSNLAAGDGGHSVTPTTKSGEETTAPSDFVLGDVNSDKKVDISDLVAVTKFLVGKDNSKVTNITLKAADVNSDKKINVKDLVLYKKYVDGKISKF